MFAVLTARHVRAGRITSAQVRPHWGQQALLPPEQHATVSFERGTLLSRFSVVFWRTWGLGPPFAIIQYQAAGEPTSYLVGPPGYEPSPKPLALGAYGRWNGAEVN